MKNSNLILIVLCVALAIFSAACSGRPSSQTNQVVEKASPTAEVRTSADVVRTSASAGELSPGGSGELAIPLSILPGYHVNANPATFDYLIATELTLDKSDGITFGKPVYPNAEKKKFQFAEEPLAVYEGNVQIKLPLQTAPGAAKGKRSLTGHLRVQACDEEKCFPPATLPVTASVELK